MLCGKRVKKCCLEMEAIGEIDELNSWLGVLIDELGENFKKEKRRLVSVQHCLFTIGTNLAALQSSNVKTCKLVPPRAGYCLVRDTLTHLEKWIDAMQSELTKLKNFILPGGGEEAAMSFYARAICRRAERSVIKLNGKYNVPAEIKQYLNRLSDCLFVLARWLNFKKGIKEMKWEK